MKNTIFVIMAIIKLNFRTRYDDVTKKGNLPLHDLRKYKNKNKDHSLHKKMRVVTRISIKSKALDASPRHMFSALFSNAIFINSG